MRRKGFTLVELIIAIMIMGILAGAMTLNSTMSRQTARKEAEKVALLLSSLTQRADRIKGSFDIVLQDQKGTTDEYQTISVDWHVGKLLGLSLPLKASTGCSFSGVVNYSVLKYPNGVLVKTVKTEEANAGCIKVKGAGESPYYVIISKDYQ